MARPRQQGRRQPTPEERDERHSLYPLDPETALKRLLKSDTPPARKNGAKPKPKRRPS